MRKNLPNFCTSIALRHKVDVAEPKLHLLSVLPTHTRPTLKQQQQQPQNFPQLIKFFLNEYCIKMKEKD